MRRYAQRIAVSGGAALHNVVELVAWLDAARQHARSRGCLARHSVACLPHLRIGVLFGLAIHVTFAAIGLGFVCVCVFDTDTSVGMRTTAKACNCCKDKTALVFACSFRAFVTCRFKALSRLLLCGAAYNTPRPKPWFGIAAFCWEAYLVKPAVHRVSGI